MLSYSDLSKAKQRWVNLVEKHFPNILDVTKGVLSYKDLQDIHANFTARRVEGKQFKVSKPLWLISNNAISRGVYKFPFSTVEEIVDEQAEPDTEMEIRYQAELAKLDIRKKK